MGGFGSAAGAAGADSRGLNSVLVSMLTAGGTWTVKRGSSTEIALGVGLRWAFTTSVLSSGSRGGCRSLPVGDAKGRRR